jgi:Ni/Fe-hydrogenase subunit HybB-like protein
VKAIDWYLICCFLFVFGVLVEYTIVLYLENIGQRKRKRLEIQKKLEKEEKARVMAAFVANVKYVKMKNVKMIFCKYMSREKWPLKLKDTLHIRTV